MYRMPAPRPAAGSTVPPAPLCARRTNAGARYRAAVPHLRHHGARRIRLRDDPPFGLVGPPVHRRRRPTPTRISTRPRGSETSTIWSTMSANPSVPDGTHFAVGAAGYKMGWQQRLRCTCDQQFRSPHQRRHLVTFFRLKPTLRSPLSLHQKIFCPDSGSKQSSNEPRRSAY